MVFTTKGFLEVAIESWITKFCSEYIYNYTATDSEQNTAPSSKYQYNATEYKCSWKRISRNMSCLLLTNNNNCIAHQLYLKEYSLIQKTVLEACQVYSKHCRNSIGKLY